MNILHVYGNFTTSQGGIAQALNGLATAQAKLGHDVIVVASIKPGEEDEVFRPEAVKVVIHMQDKLERIWDCHTLRLRGDLKENLIGSDIVHIHGIWHYPSFLGSKLANREEKPYIIAPHGALDSWCLEYKSTKKKLYMGLIQKWQLLGASVIHAVSDAESEDVKTLFPEVKTRTIHNGVDLPKSVTNADRVAAETIFPWLRGRRIILFLGRIHPIKGLDILIKAFSEAKRTQTTHALVIAGRDQVNLKEELKELAKRLAVEDKIFFTGFVEGVAKKSLLAAAEMLVQPSHSEGFSGSILEAMAFSKPVVISTGCDFPEVAMEDAGVIVSPDPHELAVAMDMISSNKELSKEMGANGRRLIEQKYSWDKIAGETIEMYKEAIAASRW